MKLYFTGSDVQLLNEFPKQLPIRKLFYVIAYRIFIRLSKLFTEEYWVVHEHLLPEIKQFGIKDTKVVPHPFNMTVYPKKKHKTFNVLYYCPEGGTDKEWNEWIYGADIYERVKYWYKNNLNVCFIEIDGSQDMSEVLPVTDFYLRCNRHDGDARMVNECKINNIPYYWSYENPDFEQIIIRIDNEKCKTLKRF